MKVFVATKIGQGIRTNDFSFTNEGELLKIGFECSHEKIDGHCGCARSLVGIDTSLATTTFKVEDRDITPEQFGELHWLSLVREGWTELYNEPFKKQSFKEVTELIRLAHAFPVGAIVERRGNKLNMRFVVKENENV